MNDLNLLDQLVDKNQAEKEAAESTKAFRIFSLILGLASLSYLAMPCLSGAVVLYAQTNSTGIGLRLATLALCLSVACGVGLVLLFAIFFSLNSFEFHVRLVGIAGGVAFCFSCLGLGLVIQNPRFAFDKLLVELLPASPVMILGICLPFLMMRYLMGWQLVFSSFHDKPTRQSVSIGGLLIFTTVIAVCTMTSQIYEAVENLVFIAVMFCGFELLFLVPFVLLVMRSSKGLRNVLFTTIGAATIFFVLNKFVGGNLLDAYSQLSMAAGFGGLFLFLGFGLLACKTSGGRLVVHADLDENGNETTN